MIGNEKKSSHLKVIRSYLSTEIHWQWTGFRVLRWEEKHIQSTDGRHPDPTRRIITQFLKKVFKILKVRRQNASEIALRKILKMKKTQCDWMKGLCSRRSGQPNWVIVLFTNRQSSALSIWSLPEEFRYLFYLLCPFISMKYMEEDSMKENWIHKDETQRWFQKVNIFTKHRCYQEKWKLDFAVCVLV